MVSLVGAPPPYDPFVEAVDHTVDETYIGSGFSEVGHGLQPGSVAVSSSWGGPTVGRPGFVGEAGEVSGAADHDLDLTYIGPGFSEVGHGLQPSSVAVTSSWSGPTVGRPGSVGEAGKSTAAADHDLDLTYVGTGFSEIGHGLQPDSAALAGALIPMAFFRIVQGEVLDEEGEPIKDGLHLAALGDFSTFGRVDSETGEYRLFLLRQVYDEFVLVVESGRSGVDYVWFQSVDASISQTDTEVDLRFEKRPISGLVSGTAASFGGPLGG